MPHLTKLMASLLLTLGTGAIGSIVTLPNLSPWYASLNKPYFDPPNWVFGPVWTLLYIAMGVGLYYVWTAKSKKPKRAALTAFGVQLALNLLWSIVFFGLHQMIAGVAVILLLFMAVIITNRLFWPISRPAAWLLIPYSLWICFAAALNVAIALMN